MSKTILMKGETWKDGQKLVRGVPRFQYPVWVEPKVDEIRLRVACTRSEKGEPISLDLLSYAEKPLFNLKFMHNDLMRFFVSYPGLNELDMGVEVNGNFNDSYRWVRSSSGYPKRKVDKRTGEVSPELFEDMVRLHLFDLPELPVEWRERRHYVAVKAHALLSFGLPMSLSKFGQLCHSYEEVMAAYDRMRELGYEGAMVKTEDHKYAQGKRTFGWMKMKPEDTYDGRITGLIEAVAGVDQPEIGVNAGDPLGRTGAIALVLEDGSVARPHGIPHILGVDMHNNPNKYIGRWIEFACMERDRQGGYRHPVFRRLREDKQ